MDITEFLAKCLDEDEVVAWGGAGIMAGTNYSHREKWAYDREYFRVVVDRERRPGESRVLIVADTNGSDVDGIHIARHDPARVLREVAAKRRVLARHVPSTGDGPYDPYCLGCGEIDGYWPRSDSVNDCPELRDMASVYSDRPGYKEEWKP